MGHQLTRSVPASVLAERLGMTWRGDDVAVDHVAAASALRPGSLGFSKQPLLVVPRGAAVFAPAATPLSEGSAVIDSSHPRLAFARALHALFADPGFAVPEVPMRVHPTARISATAVLGRGVSIGARTVVEHHVVIADGVSIGDDCHVKSNTVIGEAGFGFERDEDGIPVRLLHLGTVRIGNRVEIGSLNTVCRATLGVTVIEDDVKTDDHVHVAHNCRIGRGTLVTACAELSGGVDVGEFAWIGPNASIIQKVSVGDRSFVGIAANVTKPVASGASVAGNPAKPLRSDAG
jgi:UDP-3-O-[3-hydroxymyristoyl] glucosamine N-acyltransferase